MTGEAVEVRAYRMSWSAVLGGTVVALGVWLLLHVLGLAAGLTAMDPGESASSLRAIGIGTGVWSVIVPLIALFVGGLVAGRTAGIVDRATGAIHGAVLWSLSMVLGVLFVVTLLSSAIGAGARGAAAAVTGGASAMGGAGAAAQALGIDFDDVIAPVNERLQAQGLPPVSARQLQAATRDALGTAVRQGRMDRDLLTRSIADNTALSRGDAEQVATRIEQQFTARFGGAGQELKAGALAAADKTGKALWWIFAALTLGLVSAILGASAGVTRRQRVRADEVTTPVVTPTRTVPADPRI